eukprot:1487307-Rhodomonas_salina.2
MACVSRRGCETERSGEVREVREVSLYSMPETPRRERGGDQKHRFKSGRITRDDIRLTLGEGRLVIVSSPLQQDT